MIYISSACVKAKYINKSVSTLAVAGFKNIELSGGTQYYPDYEVDLLQLQEKHGLKYLIHNYFPPPTKPFVLNLASLNDDIYEMSIELCMKAISLSKKLGGKNYGVHAGFLIDLKPNEIGRNISLDQLSERAKSIKRFVEAWNMLKSEAKNNINFYIENNVLSSSNSITFSGENPLLLTDYDGYLELKEHMDFDLLLDIAHLKVSSNTLKLDFENELKKLLPHTDYIHLSDNDGLHDQNKSFKKGSDMLKILRNYDLNGKIFTLETYCNITELKETYIRVKKEISI